jgi:hypothetical protein
MKNKSLASVTPLETTAVMQPKEIQHAMDLVRGYQVIQFVERMKGAMADNKPSMHAADEALRKHGASPFTYQTRLDSAVLLCSLLTEAHFTNRPDLEQIRLNFIVGVANAVNQLDPALASVALGETSTKYHIPVTIEEPKRASKHNAKD